MNVTWNLTRHVRQYQRADVLVLSVGKSGRTWLRVLLNKYLSLRFEVPFGIGDLHEQSPKIPAVLFDHEMWSHYCDASWLDRLLGRNIVPDRLLRQKKIVVGYRDPRDVVVSMYFHKSKRSRRRMDVGISQFIHHRHFGVGNVVRVMNRWRARLEDHPQVCWLSYEDRKANTAQELDRLAAFIAVPAADSGHIEEAVMFSEFENMKKMEADDAFGSPILRARDVSDPDSFKVREGRVGAYRKHFGDADLRFLDEAIARLVPFYGYTACDKAQGNDPLSAFR